MITYTVRSEWDGHNWIATVDDVPGAVTQAKRLELIPGRVVEVIKLMTGKTVKPSDLEVVRRFAGRIGDEADEIAQLREDLDKLQHDLSQRQPRVIRRLRAQGLTVRDIGQVVGLSHQRVQQILNDVQSSGPKGRS